MTTESSNWQHCINVHDPSLWHDDEAVHLSAFDDFDNPTAGIFRGQRRAWPLIARIGEDFHDEGPHRACGFIEHKGGAVAILDVGGMDGNAQEQTERIDEEMSLAAGDFLARVVALRIEQSPPFGAPLALWLSMMAAVGLASRPSISRTAT